MINTRLHNIWKNMKSRCTYERHEDFDLYGGRGITVCDEWLNSFDAFESWANNNGYSDGLSIDRIEFNGETHTMKEWAEILGIKYGTLQSRIARGWSYKKALTKK